MKELSIEEKAKCFDEVLEKAKKYHSLEIVCNVRIAIDIRFNGESPRDKWIFGTNQFIDYSKELTEYLEEVCSM